MGERSGVQFRRAVEGCGPAWFFGVNRILRLRPANRCGPSLRMLAPFRDVL